MKRQVLSIGTEVRVYEQVDNPTNYRTGDKSIVRVKEDSPVIGQIVGGAYIAVGKYHTSPPMYAAYDYGDSSPYIEVDRMVFVYLVHLGFTNKPIKVLPQNIVPQFHKIGTTLPFRRAKKVKWTDKDRELQRHNMSSVPRDSKGRWLK